MSKIREKISWKAGINLDGRHSSNVERYAYVESVDVFLVKFNSSPGITYGYPHFSQEELEDFEAAPSKGKWIHQHLVLKAREFFVHDDL